ncbi:MAG: ATP-binding protein, partial [Smithellaceae bacterium]|nr:ATP-binding protein [Smithellaceae bacterium]
VRHLRLTAEFGFGMIVKINEEEIFAIARQGLKQALVISGLGFFLVLSLVYVFSRRITQPLIRLRGTAEQVMAGDLGARAAVTTRDEVGYLAASFNSMVSEIQKGQEELETRVRERTAALDLELTARRQAEEELQKYRNRLEDLVQERTVELVEAQEALVSIVEDLNEKTVQLAEAMDQAQSADRLKSAFLANMSHELRTPLNSIIGFTGIVLQGMSGPLNDEQAKQLTMVKGSANHLLALINDVLDISKIEAGQVEIRRRSFDMRSIVETVMATLMPLAAKKGLSLESAIAADVGAIISDRRRVEQILLNLVNNAVKFTEEGVVRIVARIVRGAAFGARSQEPSSVIPAEAGIQEPVEKSEGGVVSELHGNFPEISVADTGIGIKPEDMDKLFLPFSQIDAGLARRHEGTGLGLSICRRLAEMLGGTMRVEGEWGRGSVFTFTLPV